MKYPRLPHDLRQHIKLTVRDIELVRWLYHSGKIKSIKRLASCFNTTTHTINYWIDPLFREEAIKRRIKELTIQYKTDPMYRKKSKKWSNNSYMYHIKIDPNMKKYAIERNRKYNSRRVSKTDKLKPFKSFMEMIECHI